jgi:hypothetical protein
MQDWNLPWKTWITTQSPYPYSQGLNNSFLGKTIFKNLQLLRDMTQCTVRSGRNAFFWLGRWLLPKPLTITHAALYSHHLMPYSLVCDIFELGVQHGLRNRLPDVASIELASLLSLMQVYQITQESDDRTMIDGQKFSTRAAYMALQDSHNDDYTSAIWNSSVLGRVKIFGWLLHLNNWHRHILWVPIISISGSA